MKLRLNFTKNKAGKITSLYFQEYECSISRVLFRKAAAIIYLGL